MQLIGRNLSPFVRRTAIVLNLLDLKYEQVGLSTADDMAEIAKHNPIVRVPAMILDDGEALLDSNAIIDHLLEVADPDNRLLPASGAERRAVLRLAAIGHGIMEKAVSSSYERNRRPKEKVFDGWVNQVEDQVKGGLAALNAAAAQAKGGEWLCGDHPTLADVNAAVAHDFTQIVAPYIMKDDPYPALTALAQRGNAMPAFGDTAFKPG
ncbi:MAG: glutathione S-transferase family protein [Rhodospirillaceae bacterium]|jgi:glutathione S-transferase|nr:glutathione S-transferase family protein [Rhodospirillaceae bacterium]MBT4041979.1 glutathione S-transferase family protein [Rhodospirillaceae bacterium]MBT4691528.1 glutathione S-transferase family protein [Rhodospirillaceae bacterium]MBT5083031.1 glutathione S-transferase family protein [Rhodospirillaceae bacterium]MBT5524475.1 glutathione S-transferase family protein [Rhodospirillaceae bacterium]